MSSAVIAAAGLGSGWLMIAAERLRLLGRRAARVAVVACVVGAVGWWSHGLVPAAFVGWGWLRRVHRRRVHQREMSGARSFLPETSEVLAVALSAGLTVPQAASLAASSADNAVADGLQKLLNIAEQGYGFQGACLRIAQDDAEVMGPLAAMLSVAHRSGAGAVAVLRRYADHEREMQRRRTQESMRRLPVRLLPPLVTCVLPAFVLLTVMPIVLAVFGSLSLPSIGS